jgi:hypothetical protein
LPSFWSSLRKLWGGGGGDKEGKPIELVGIGRGCFWKRKEGQEDEDGMATSPPPFPSSSFWSSGRPLLDAHCGRFGGGIVKIGILMVKLDTLYSGQFWIQVRLPAVANYFFRHESGM